MAAAPRQEAASAVSGLGKRLHLPGESRFTGLASPCLCGAPLSAACARAELFSRAGLFPRASGYSMIVLCTVWLCRMWTPASPDPGTRVRAECRSHLREVEVIAVEFEKRGPWF